MKHIIASNTYVAWQLQMSVMLRYPWSVKYIYTYVAPNSCMFFDVPKPGMMSAQKKKHTVMRVKRLNQKRKNIRLIEPALGPVCAFLCWTLLSITELATANGT